MPNSGKARKAKRGLRRANEKAEATLTTTFGEHWGKGGAMDQKLVGQAIRGRWLTDANTEALEPVMRQAASASVRDLAVLVVRKGMLSGLKAEPSTEEVRAAQTAVRNLIAMEGQNQRDELEVNRKPQQHEHLHQHVQIVLPHNGRDDLPSIDER